jgi:cell division protein FtsQ
VTVISRTSGVVVRARDRFRVRRRTQARRWWIRALLVVVPVTGLAVAGWFLANSSMFALQYVTVEGTSRLSPTEVLSAASVDEGTSLVRLDLGAVERRVERLRPVAHVRVHRRWPHGLVIDVVERRPSGVVMSNGRAELLDAEGVAFASVVNPPEHLVRVHVSAPVPGDGEAVARTAMRVLAELPARVRARVSSVAAPSPYAISLRLVDGRTVIWGSADDAATKAAVLRTLMHRSAQVYDVSVPTVAVTRG